MLAKFINPSSYYLRVNKNETQHCRFHCPFAESPMIYIKYSIVRNIADVSFRPEIVAKINDP